MALVTNVIQGSNAQRLLLLVHGYGADERDLGALVPYLDPDGMFAVVLPRGPHAAPGTPGFMWYPFDDPSGFDTARAELDALVDEQCEALGFARSEAILGGFSQGAGLALGLALYESDPPNVRPAGALAMSPMPGNGALAEGATDVPVLIQHGTNDPLIPVQTARDLAATLLAAGVP